MKFYTVYKTTNTITKEYYIGIHITSNPNDSYMGSGKGIKESIFRYGLEFFNKEVLFSFRRKEDMIKKEKELVNRSTISDPLCLNRMIGGYGGFSFINENGIKKFHGKKHSDKTKEEIGKHSRGRPKSAREIEKLRYALRKNKEEDPEYYEKKRKGGINRWKNHKSTKIENKSTPRKGRIWINNGKISKMILPYDLYLYPGFLPGRI